MPAPWIGKLRLLHYFPVKKGIWLIISKKKMICRLIRG